MKKMKLLFKRDFSNPRKPITLNEVQEGCEWVLNGEGVATRKWDGTSCAVINGELYARYDAKRGKNPPVGAIPCQPEPDLETGHFPHWVKVENQPEYKWHREAWDRVAEWASNENKRILEEHNYDPKLKPFENATYELVGPKVQGNAENLTQHSLIKHFTDRSLNVERSFEGIKEFLRDKDIEGIVFWRDSADPDCDKVKIRKKDFDYST